MKIITIALIALFSLSLNAKNMMWKVESEKGTVYVLGSVHIAKESLYPLDSSIENSYKESDFLVVEVNLNDIDPSIMMNEMMLPPDQTLEDVVEPETFKKLSQELAKVGVQPMQYLRFKPWAATFLIIQSKLSQTGYNMGKGIDKYYLDKAARDQRAILELESMEFQISMFNEFDKAPGDYLDYSLDNVEEIALTVDDIFKAWSAGDTTQLSELMFSNMETYPEYERIYELLLDKRNVNMVKEIEKYLQTSKTYFVVVGAGHLIGDQGIIKLLDKKKKYKLEQM